MTIKDIAKLAGVAQSTVSNVLNGTKCVTPETEQRVRAVIEAMNYTPNHLARSLKSNHTKTIGLVTPNITNFYYAAIIESVEERLRENGYNIILSSSQYSKEEETKAISLLVNRGVDGLVLLCFDGKFDASPLKRDLPIVTIDHKINHPSQAILVDNTTGGYMATEYLIKKQRRKILYLAAIIKNDAFFDRMIGYRNALRDHNLSYDSDYVVECHASTTFEDGYDTMNRIFERGIPFDGIFSASYYITIGVMRSIVEHGLRMPEDISIVSFDDPPLAAFSFPPLTTIRQPEMEIGALAAKQLVEMINTGNHEERVHTIEPLFMERGSA